jgi:hypothetical protein
MAENVEVKAVETEEPSIQEKEQAVAEKSGTVFEDGVYKVDLRQPPVTEQEKPQEDAVQNTSTEESVLRSDEQSEEAGQEAEVELQEVGEGNEETIEEVILEEVTDEENTTEDIQEEAPTAEEIVEAVEESQQTGIDLPENIQKVVDFINETGGTLEDYVALNKDYSSVDDMTLLRDYYKQNKPHLSAEEIDFLIEDSFSFDEDVDDERDIKRKKLRFKEEVAQARQSLEGLKDQYYKEIKAGSKLTPDQQKAVDFFNRYNKETEESSKIAEQQQNVFLEKTNQVFNDKFKGFEYNVGDKKYRFNVKNTNEVKAAQSDINNFIKKFLDNDNVMNDAKGYHKSLFTAMNPDAIANHFYEQGRADALKQSIGTSKNINMDPRGVHNKANNDGGIKARVVGDDISKLKLKLKNY